jgi:carboxyl-terminal processing protease
LKNNFLLLLTVTISIITGIIIGSDFFLSVKSSKKNTTERLSKLIKYLNEDYVDNIDVDSLVGKIIKDIVDQLDPHSVYIPSSEQQQITENMQGNFVGIGVSFFMIQDTIAVVRVLEGGPSEKVGIKSGDRILIADKDTLFQKTKTSEEVVSRLKGKSNSPVDLKVYRKLDDSIYNFRIVRGSVPLPSIPAYYMLNSQTGYLKINRFSQTTFIEFNNAMKSLVDQNVNSLILDLRGNPGGYLLPAKQIADSFLSSGKPIVIVESNKGKREKTVSTNEGFFKEGVLYVLVDEQSASASEVVAGAIQDNDRGWILGRRTFGKGLVQQQMPLGKGDLIRLTTARYFTPTGRSIQRQYRNDNKEEYYAEVQSRFETGEMKDESKIPKIDSLIFKTPNGRIVYGGGGIVPDIYLSNDNSIEEEWNDLILRSNLVNRFVFLQIDKFRSKYIFRNPAKFYNEPLIDSALFLKSFKEYCQQNNFPLKIKDDNSVINSIKAYVGLQLFDEKIYTRIINQQDPFILKALSEIKNKKAIF